MAYRRLRVLAVAAALAAAATVAGCERGRPVTTVSRPPAAAAPADVVRAYVAALNARDLDTARLLTTPTHFDKVRRSEESWYRNVVSITELDVGAPVAESGVGTRAEGMAEVVRVPVRFVLRQRRALSMPNGDTVWGYLLGRGSPGERWRIVDEGPV